MMTYKIVIDSLPVSFWHLLTHKMWGQQCIMYCYKRVNVSWQRIKAISPINAAVTVHFQSLKPSAFKERAVANPEALRIDIIPRLTNQSPEMERPSFDRLFVRNGLFWSPPYWWHRMGDLLIVWYPNLSPSSQSSRCLHLFFFFGGTVH